MFTRFVSAETVTNLITADDSGSHTFTFPSTRQAAIYLRNPATKPYCTYEPANGGEVKLVEIHGSAGNTGVYVGTIYGEPGESYTLKWLVGRDLTADIQAQDPSMLLALGSSVGPVSISTQCYGASHPFTVIFTARPLFLNRFPLLDTYSGSSTTVALSGISGLVGAYEHVAIEYAVNQLLRFKLTYAYDAGADIGKVISATIRSPYTSSSTVPAYTLAADLVIARSYTGSQEYGSQEIIVGAENPSNYLKKRYIPTPAYTYSMEYLPIQPVVLTAGEGEVQSGGRIMFERSNLYLGEASPMRYLINCIVYEGAGQIMISPDHAPKFSELSEYEF